MKKIVLIISIFFLLFLNINIVKAKDITMEEVVEKIKEMSSIPCDEIDDNGIDFTICKSDDENISYTLEESKLKIKISNIPDTDETIDFEYEIEDNILSHTYKFPKNISDTNLDDDEINYALINVFMDTSLTYVVSLLQGYTSRDFSLFLKEDADITKDGYSWKLNDIDDKDANITFKLDIDKFNLVLNYIDDIPELILGEITNNSISLSYKVTDEEQVVEIYRSKDGDKYEHMIDVTFYEDAQSYWIDDDLEAGTTYYYKVRFQNGKDFSEPVKVSTLGKSSVPIDVDTETKNPQTGYTDILLVSLSGIILLSSLMILRRKNKIYNI